MQEQDNRITATKLLYTIGDGELLGFVGEEKKNQDAFLGSSHLTVSAINYITVIGVTGAVH